MIAWMRRRTAKETLLLRRIEMNKSKAVLTAALTLMLASLFIKPANAQSIILDNQVRAGDLILFQSVNNPNEYYYVADNASLATTDSGKPQFSFLRYVEPNVSAEVENRDGTGGGIVHAVVRLLTTEDTINRARSDLQRINSNGIIVGPATFRSGTFALVSSFAEEGSDFTDKVLGVGNAPILDGQAAAVSLNLTKKGAQVLWESFNTSTPDISFSFNMELDGYRSPKRAVLEADFSRVYSNDRFAAAVATPMLQAEIDAEFEKLRNEGAIKLTQIGDDEDLDGLIRTAYDHLTRMIFDRADTSGSNPLAGVGQQQDSMLDKASNLLQTSRQETREENDKVRERNAQRSENRAAAAEANSRLRGRREQVASAESGADLMDERAEHARRTAQQLRSRAAEEQDEASKAELREIAEQYEAQAGRYERVAQDRRSDADGARSELAEDEAEAGRTQELANSSSADQDEEVEELPSLAIVASYRLKRVEQSGSYRIDLNKYTADTLTLRFDENIGDLTSELSDTNMFRTVDISASAFRQREIPVFIDGLNVSDFGDFVNFANVVMRKKHENGRYSTDDVRIDRDNFESTANNFKLSYLKLDDKNMDRWMNYEYQVHWSFFGAHEIKTDWKPTNQGAITLTPPYQKRSVLLDADPARITELGVRSIEFTLHHKLGDSERPERISLRPNGEQGLSRQVTYISPRDSYDYDYQISWRLPNSERAQTQRISSTDGTIFIDEIPGR